MKIKAIIILAMLLGTTVVPGIASASISTREKTFEIEDDNDFQAVNILNKTNHKFSQFNETGTLLQNQVRPPLVNMTNEYNSLSQYYKFSSSEISGGVYQAIIQLPFRNNFSSPYLNLSFYEMDYNNLSYKNGELAYYHNYSSSEYMNDTNRTYVYLNYSNIQPDNIYLLRLRWQDSPLYVSTHKLVETQSTYCKWNKYYPRLQADVNLLVVENINQAGTNYKLDSSDDDMFICTEYDVPPGDLALYHSITTFSNNDNVSRVVIKNNGSLVADPDVIDFSLIHVDNSTAEHSREIEEMYIYRNGTKYIPLIVDDQINRIQVDSRDYYTRLQTKSSLLAIPIGTYGFEPADLNIKDNTESIEDQDKADTSIASTLATWIQADKILKFFTGTSDKIQQKFQQASNWAGARIQSVIDWLSEKLSSVVDVIVGIGEKIWGKITEFYEVFTDTLFEFLSASQQVITFLASSFMFLFGLKIIFLVYYWGMAITSKSESRKRMFNERIRELSGRWL